MPIRNLSFNTAKIILIIFAVLAVIFIATVFFVDRGREVMAPEELVVEEKTGPKIEIIGKSVLGRDIKAYTFGDGQNHLLFVGGIHGGYEWNSVLLAYRLIDYLNTSPETADNLKVTIIPNANPDGVFKIIGKEGRFAISDVKVGREQSRPGRFNANEVDLNRNFDCKWQPESMWQERVVSAGTAPFSEPEARAIRDFVLENRPDAAVFFHSRANAVYASECEDGILPKTREILDAYSRASGYPPVDSFDHYEITGDVEGWLASIGVPAITVELKTHDSIEWERNLLGIQALFGLFEKSSVW